MQSGNIVIPGSKNPDHIRDNFAIFDFELASEDMEKLLSGAFPWFWSWDRNCGGGLDRGCNSILGKTYVEHPQTLKGDFTMKKIMLFLLSVVMVFSLASCGGQDGARSTSTP